MRLLVYSDLHLEMDLWYPPLIHCDLVILAGDIHNGIDGVKWATRAFGDTPVLYVPGNHEFYGHIHPELIDAMRAQAKGSQVHVLDQEWLRFGNLCIFGCTLWTDFCLDETPEFSMSQARKRMRDFRVITTNEGKLFSPQYSAMLHRQALAWLQSVPYHTPAGKHQRIIISHHLPLRHSISPEFSDNLLNPAFASDLSAIVCRIKPHLWIHGHSHLPCDYQFLGTRFVCNPKGYPGENGIYQPLLLHI